MTNSTSSPAKGEGMRTGALSLGLGLGITLAIFVLIKFISNDMRWVLWLGSAGFLGAAHWVGNVRRGSVLGFLLLCSPLMLVYGALVVPQLPGLWPHLVLWLGFALLGWYGLRFGFRSRVVAPAVLTALIVGSVWYGAAYIPEAISRSLSQYRNDPAPPFDLVHLDGSPFPMESLEGKVVVLDFFATWCGPCIAELPELAEIRREVENLDGVEILVVANDSGGDTPESISAFVAERDLDLKFVYDTGGKAHTAFGFAGLPGLVVMDRLGNIRLTREGYNSAETHFQDDLLDLIESL
jgi:thiol-disulfide isomerase/thioredoxin